MTSPRIYCSGPLFCPEEVAAMAAIANTLETAGYSTFLPARDGLEAWVLPYAKAAWTSLLQPLRAQLDYAIFSLDLYELVDCCDAVVCNLNGRVPDEGMIVEASLAFAAGIPVLFFKDDIRSAFAGRDNAMLTSLGAAEPIRSLNALPKAVERILLDEIQSIELSVPMQQTLSYGKTLSSFLHRIGFPRGKSPWPEDLIMELLKFIQPFSAPGR